MRKIDAVAKMPTMTTLQPPTAPRRPRYQPLVIVLAAAALGIVGDRFGPLPVGAWGGAAVVGLIGWRMAVRCDRLVWGQAALLVAVAATAASWHYCQWRLFAADELGRYARPAGQPICVEALAVSSPRPMPAPAFDPLRGMPEQESSRMDVELVALRNGSTWQPVSGRATLRIVGRLPDAVAGDRMRCFAALTAPAPSQNPGELDYAVWLRSERKLCALRADAPECVQVVEPGGRWTVVRWLERLRCQGRALLDRSLRPEQSELAAAVLLGLREELDTPRNEAFLATGTIHILSISGLHVGILAGALFWILRRTRLSNAMIAIWIAATTILYAMMVDAEPPVLRSAVLVLVGCAALCLNRPVLSMNALAAAALAVLVVNPSHLFHVGAQLSFLCVAGLIWIAGKRQEKEDDASYRIKQTLARLMAQNLSWPRRCGRSLVRASWGIALTGAVLWGLTLPLVLARFHIGSFSGLILNALLWPLMTWSVLSGFVLLAFGWICPPLGWICGRVCEITFRGLEGAIDAVAQIPGSHFWTPGPSDVWLLGFYVGLAVWAAMPQWRPPRRWCAALLAGWILVGVAPSLWPHDPRRLDATFLSVGHGCATLVELPDGRTLLYDAGRLGGPQSAARTISECLWHRGYRRIDAMVLSHPDVDHYNAVPGLLEKFSVGAVYVSESMFDKKNAAILALRRAIDASGTPIRAIRAGDRLRLGDQCEIEVLHPLQYGTLGSENANSVVLAVRFSGHEILLPGDLESPGLEQVLAEEPHRCDVLLAPHHGSRKSNSPGTVPLEQHS
ncbi:MAG: ComEC/Rec2 family competence protein [Thermoguttaceae bacterium]